uniref:Uncharacterized protein At1g15400-like n=1 Tax=Nicotiana sylvestris TaxID=4096 RepID=A0A1U7XQZ4_NICSY|nr:PREDICTED: uncharacterized protein At1g15400-like [Nicotiana sylvestris]
MAATTGEILSRSEISFRRQGSSGLIWDDKLLSGELNKISTHDHPQEHKKKEQKSSSSSEQKPRISYRSADNYIEPSTDPPSPKLSGCGVCGIFGKPVKSNKPRKSVRL